MRRRISVCLTITAATLFLAFVALANAAAAEKTALELLPPTTIGYLEVPNPAEVIGLLVDHPLTKEILQQPAYQKAIDGRPFRQIQGAQKIIEEKTGTTWGKALEAAASGGLYVGFDLPTQGIVALLQSADESTAMKARETVLAVARAEASANGRPDPVKVDELRGVTIHQIGNVYLAVLDKWLLASNKSLLVNMVLENYLGSDVSLGSDEQFRTVRKNRNPAAAAWLYADLRVLRLTGVLRGIASKKSNNPPLEFLAGGVLGALPDASFATASLELDRSHMRLHATLPGNPKSVAKSREFYFGPAGAGVAPPLLDPPGTLLAFSAHRDLASMWRHAPDLFDDRINAQLAQAESGLATFFGGRNFRDEILGNLEPGMQVVVARQQFPQAQVTPAIKLPAAALVMRMKDPEKTARTFKITFQSVIGFINIIGGMRGLPPLDLNSEKTADGLIVTTEYLPPDKPETRLEAPIHHNASPTAVFMGDSFILASARPLAMHLMEQLRSPPPAGEGLNTSLRVDGVTVRSALADNREPLVARNMLDRGHDRAAAEKEIDGVLRALTNVERSSIQLSATGGQLELAIEVAFAAVK